MGIPIRSGRAFERTDANGSAPVLIVDQAFEQRWYPGESALGRRVRIIGGWRTIVGVAGGIRDRALTTAPTGRMYVPMAQAPRQTMTLVAKAPGDPLDLIGGVREVVRRVGADQPLSDVAALQDWRRDSMASTRFLATILTALGAFALFLAALGLYGVLAFNVARRTREIGIRMSLGAQRSRLQRAYVAKGLWMALVGAGLGCGVAAAVVRSLESQLYGVEALDGATFAAVFGVIVAVGGISAFLPARTATLVQPVEALRVD